MPTIESVLSLQEKQVRVVWDDAKEEYFFAIADVVGILAECEDYDAAGNYWRVLKHRLAKERNQFITNCNKQRMVSPKDGKRYPTDVADKEQLFRIIQSIPSKKAEPVKMWIAKVARTEMEKQLGYSIVSSKNAKHLNAPDSPEQIDVQ